ncbi:MAG: hypothetical protein R2795_10090 [Saprospiraceae bacterium]
MYQRAFVVWIGLVALLLATGCGSEGHPKGWKPLDLLPYGVATTILAPPDAQVKHGNLSSVLVKDVSIHGGPGYNVQLFYSPATTNDIARLKNDHLQNVKANRYFKKIVKEEVAGFIYQSIIDSTETYGFRFVKLQGDTELNFQSGLGNLFTQEEAELMYEAVK